MGDEVTIVECPDPDNDEVTFQFASGNVGGAFAINQVGSVDIFTTKHSVNVL